MATEAPRGRATVGGWKVFGENPFPCHRFSSSVMQDYSFNAKTSRSRNFD
jgi:hypothetical protein